jgi:hypothetical protein
MVHSPRTACSSRKGRALRARLRRRILIGRVPLEAADLLRASHARRLDDALVAAQLVHGERPHLRVGRPPLVLRRRGADGLAEVAERVEAAVRRQARARSVAEVRDAGGDKAATGEFEEGPEREEEDGRDCG